MYKYGRWFNIKFLVITKDPVNYMYKYGKWFNIKILVQIHPDEILMFSATLLSKIKFLKNGEKWIIILG